MKTEVPEHLAVTIAENPQKSFVLKPLSTWEQIEQTDEFRLEKKPFFDRFSPTKNAFSINNNQGQQIFEADVEVARGFFTISPRSFVMTGKDDKLSIVLRPYALGRISTGLLSPDTHTIIIECPPGEVIGEVQSEEGYFSGIFSVFDNTGTRIFDSNRTMNFLFDVFPDDNYEIKDLGTGRVVCCLDRQKIMTVGKRIKVSFPVSMTIEHKILMLSLCFLLHYKFERASKRLREFISLFTLLLWLTDNDISVFDINGIYSLFKFTIVFYVGYAFLYTLFDNFHTWKYF